MYVGRKCTLFCTVTNAYPPLQVPEPSLLRAQHHVRGSEHHQQNTVSISYFLFSKLNVSIDVRPINSKLTPAFRPGER